MEHLQERRRAADLADLRIRIGHPVEHLEQVPVRTAELVDRHGKIKASRGIRRPLRARKVRRADGRDGHDPRARRTGAPPLPRRDRASSTGACSSAASRRSPLAVAVFLLVQLDKLAAARGRDPAALRRPPLADGRLRHRPRQARRRTAPLPARLDRRAHGRRAARDAPALRALRGREHPGDRDPRQPARRARARRSPPPRSPRRAGCCSSTASTRGCTASSCSSRRSRTSRSSAR